ncbi:MAG: MATE family efflux transporter [Lachnospiraceae bacterium]|nr:MATE family efflux transporter [Lachnospiraceae bacterium]
MAMTKKNEINLTEGPYLSKIIRFSLPIMATGLLQILFNSVDGMVVGKFVGDEALAAVTSTGSLVNLIVGLFMGVSVGTNVLVAQFYGAKRAKDMHETAHTSVFLALVLGVIVLLIGQFLSRTMLEVMKSPEDVIDLATLYLRIYFLGAPVLLLYNFCAAMLRAIGDTKRPLLFLAIGGVLNVLLNLFCVLVLNLGVAGVAIGTVASQLVSAVLCVVYLMRSNGPVKIVPKDLKITWRKAAMILKIGIPAGLQGIMFSISNVIIQTALNSFGKVVMAGNGAATQIEGFNYIAMNSIYHAAINFVGQNVGAKRYDRVKKGVWICGLTVSVIGAVLGVLSYVFGHFLLGLYTNSEESIRVGMLKMLIVGLPYWICGLMEVLSGAVRGLGASMTPLITTVLGTCVFRVVWIFTVFASIGTIESLYSVYVISWTITGIGHLVGFIILFRSMRRKLENVPQVLHEEGGGTTA